MAELRQRPPMAARHAGYLPDRLIAAKADGEASVAEPYRGIAGATGLRHGLYAIAPTGISTGALRTGAEDYLASLNDAQRKATSFSIDSDAWRRWSNIHPFLMRHGCRLEEMNEGQRAKALELVAAALSEEGFATARDVMRLNERLLELSGSQEEYGEWLYWMSIFGTPSATEPWGFQLDGHHLIVNCFVLGDQIVVTPMFLGSEPVYADGGKYRGTRVFAREEAVALGLARSLSPEQFARARLAPNTPDELFSAAFRDNLVLEREGLAYPQLDDDQQRRLLELIGCHVGRITPGHGELKMDEVRRHLEETSFSWMGDNAEESVFYYRVHSPVLLIEFDHLAGVAFDNDEPTRGHIHSVLRTPNGNDYGMDLLGQHYRSAHKAEGR